MHENGKPYGTPGYYHLKTLMSEKYIDYGGWKLHISVDPGNYKIVDKWLDNNFPGQYKLLSGGERGESDFTIYVGNKDDAVFFANRMIREIGRYLEDIYRGTDMKFNEKVSGRFDPRGVKNRYNGLLPSFGEIIPRGVHYGRSGLPYDDRAADIRMQINYNKTDLAKREEWQEMLRDHETALRKDLAKKYGILYTGTGDNMLLRKKKTSKPKTKKKCRCKK